MLTQSLNRAPHAGRAALADGGTARHRDPGRDGSECGVHRRQRDAAPSAPVPRSRSPGARLPAAAGHHRFRRREPAGSVRVRSLPRTRPAVRSHRGHLGGRSRGRLRRRAGQHPRRTRVGRLLRPARGPDDPWPGLQRTGEPLRRARRDARRGALDARVRRRSRHRRADRDRRSRAAHDRRGGGRRLRTGVHRDRALDTVDDRARRASRLADLGADHRPAA